MAVAENKLYGSIKKAFLGNERAKDTRRLVTLHLALISVQLTEIRSEMK